MTSETNGEKNIPASNVTSLEQWKKEKEASHNETGLKRYFNLLDFYDLITESESLAEEISDEKKYNQSQAKKSKALIGEMAERVGAESVGLASLISQMTKKIEQKIKNISKN